MDSIQNSTIVAVATPQGYGGVGIIRLSGSQSVEMALKLLPSLDKSQLVPQRVTLQKLIHPETSQVLDEVLITWFKSPASFTGEDVVEISCHGSPVILSEILRLLCLQGARLADPGEFSLRAFLNGRMDLAQAEAINDLIHSQTLYQAQLAARQLRGELSTQLRPIKESLTEMIVYFESSVEFVEDDLDGLEIERFKKRIDELTVTITQLISSYRLGRLVRSGIRLALVGKPNVGKSSLFNSLLGRERAIVTHIPGTTRDTITETCAIHGIPVELIDTAGIRETSDLVEKIGVERTRTAIAEADYVIAVMDASLPLESDGMEFLQQISTSLVVLNKCDLTPESVTDTMAAKFIGRPFLRVSALTGENIDALREAVYRDLTESVGAVIEGGIITSERHYAALEGSLEALQRAKSDLDSGLTEEIVLVNLHNALRSLGVITGETLIGDIINRIFLTFCIGK
jgi:tRNA modification GTPase